MREVLLGELLSDKGITYGVVKPGDHSPNGIPLIKAADVGNGRVNASPAFKISQDKHQEHCRTELTGGELLITLVGTPGQCAIAPAEIKGFNVVRAVGVFNVEPIADNRYIMYAIQGPRSQSHIRNVCNTTVQATLNLGDLKGLPLSIPPLAEQKAIAHILGTLDDKIELNRKTSETLEAMAKALFKSWFVDFDPVRAKAEGRPTGLPAEISDLFPDSFEDSELGEIPSGWRVHPLSDIFSIQGGSQPPAKTFVDFPGNGYVRLLQIRDFLGDNHLTFVPESKNLRIVGEDDVLIGRYGSGSGKFMDDSLGRPLRGLSGAINVAVVKTLPRQKNMIELIYCMVLSGWFYRQIVGGSSRAVQAGFRKEDLDLIPFPTPPNSILDAFQEIGSKFWHRTKALDIQAKSLCQIRDALLPKLISGEIRIPDAEKLLEEVGV